MRTPAFTIPRRLVELGGAVEELGGLWHVAKTHALTYCGEDCEGWPRVARAVERCGIWCGSCLIAAAEAHGPEAPLPGEIVTPEPGDPAYERAAKAYDQARAELDAEAGPEGSS